MSENIVEGTKPLVKGGVYVQPNGCFGIVTKSQPTPRNKEITDIVTWQGCRDSFHVVADLVKLREYYYTHHANGGPDIADYIYRVESHLGIKEKTKFQYTENNKVSWVIASPWWVCNQMRNSFFTICLRAALLWRRNANMNWRDVLFLQNYAATTRKAVERFLDGYTHYTGLIRGWARQFTGYDQGSPPTATQLEGLLITQKEVVEKMAYFKWVNAGKPQDCQDRFWDEAEKEYCGVA
jgi:hypothetical protein